MDSRPRYVEVLSAHFIGMQVEKKLFGKKYIRAAPMLTVCAFLFETGATLGSCFKDHLPTFLIPFCAEQDHKLLDFLPGEAQRVAADVKDAESIHQLFFISEMRRQQPDADAAASYRRLASRAQERVSPEDALKMGPIYGVMGVAYGAYCPDSFAELYALSYGGFDQRAGNKRTSTAS